MDYYWRPQRRSREGPRPHPQPLSLSGQCVRFKTFLKRIYAEVVTRVASSLEAVGLPGYPEVLFVEINVIKSRQRFVALYFTRIWKTQGLKLYMKCLHV